MDSDEDNARKIREHYEEWIRRYNMAKETLPSVVQGQENAAWRVEAYDVLRGVYPGIARELNKDWEKELTNLRATLPLSPIYRPQMVLSTSSSTAMGNNQAVMALISVRQGTEADAGLNRMLDAYTVLQEKQGKAMEVRNRVRELFPSLDRSFDSAVSTYESAKADAALRPNAALAMRNFIQKFQGELVEMARAFPKENMPWETMAERLGGNNAQALAEERITYGRLHNLLSNIQKGWPVSQTLADIWPQFLDHVFAVSGYVLAATRGR